MLQSNPVISRAVSEWIQNSWVECIVYGIIRVAYCKCALRACWRLRPGSILSGLVVLHVHVIWKLFTILQPSCSDHMHHTRNTVVLSDFSPWLFSYWPWNTLGLHILAPPPDDAKLKALKQIHCHNTLLVLFLLLFSITDIKLSILFPDIVILLYSLFFYDFLWIAVNFQNILTAVASCVSA